MEVKSTAQIGSGEAAAHSSVKDFLFARVTITDYRQKHGPQPRHTVSFCPWVAAVLQQVMSTPCTGPGEGGSHCLPSTQEAGIWEATPGSYALLSSSSICYPLQVCCIPFQRRESRSWGLVIILGHKASECHSQSKGCVWGDGGGSSKALWADCQGWEFPSANTSCGVNTLH